MSVSTLKYRFVALYREMIRLNSELRESIISDSGECLLSRDSRFSLPSPTDRHYGATALSEADYLDPDQNPEQTICVPGVIAVSAQSMKLAKSLNGLKGKRIPRLREKIKKETASSNVSFLTSNWLKKAGLGTINRRQANRLLRFFPKETPTRIQFGWYRVPRIKKMSAGEAIQYIQANADDERLELLKQSVVTSKAPAFGRRIGKSHHHLRANVAFGTNYEMHTSPLPILVRNDEPFPEVVLPPAGPWEKNFQTQPQKRRWDFLAPSPLTSDPVLFYYTRDPEINRTRRKSA